MHILINNKKNQKISRNFNSDEFKCKCNHSDCVVSFIDEELISLLEEVRTYFNAPVKINSGYRCINHNTSVGGSTNSRHKHGTAADIVVQGVLPKVVYEFLVKRFPTKYGIGSYNSFTHIDVRDEMARWNG